MDIKRGMVGGQLVCSDRPRSGRIHFFSAFLKSDFSSGGSHLPVSYATPLCLSAWSYSCKHSQHSAEILSSFSPYPPISAMPLDSWPASSFSPTTARPYKCGHRESTRRGTSFFDSFGTLYSLMAMLPAS